MNEERMKDMEERMVEMEKVLVLLLSEREITKLKPQQEEILDEFFNENSYKAWEDK